MRNSETAAGLIGSTKILLYRMKSETAWVIKQAKSTVTNWNIANRLISLHNVYHTLQRFSSVITLRNLATVPHEITEQSDVTNEFYRKNRTMLRKIDDGIKASKKNIAGQLVLSFELLTQQFLHPYANCDPFQMKRYIREVKYSFGKMIIWEIITQ